MSEAIALMATKKEREARLEGFDGSELHIRERLIPGTSRKQVTVIRAKQGTFEWRFGGAQPNTMLDMLYEAGNRYAILRERCGMDAPGPVDWASVGKTQWVGLPPNRILAMEEFKRLVQSLGQVLCSRLDHYVVAGKTTKQLARLYRQSPKGMTVQLELDLARIALHFRMITTP